MSLKNINKIFPFVIAALTITAAGCGLFERNGLAQRTEASSYSPPVETGKLASDDLKEASGVAASKCQPGIYWAHNDSGDDALIYAINEKGHHLGVWVVAGAANKDWEDIAVDERNGKCTILIGDIGNNDADRDTLAIYGVDEPSVSRSAQTAKASKPLKTSEARKLLFQYPDGRKNAEALLAHPTEEVIYILIKDRSGPSAVYKLKAVFADEVQTAVKLTELAVPAVPNGVITGGDISPDGSRVVLCDYFNGYELMLPAGQDFDHIWKQKPQRIDIGKRKAGEAITFTADGKALIALSEKRNTPVIRVDRK